MAAILRHFQINLVDKINHSWSSGSQNVLAVQPTGTGKTVVFSHIIARHGGASCAIAHRQELVGQISLALAREGIRHRIIGPTKVIRFCVQIHMEELGVSSYDPNAPCAVAGVDTLIKRADELSGWTKSVTLWVMDEAHHVLKTNKWGKAVLMFPNAIGLGVTATPERTDGYGLGRSFDGVFDTLVEGIQMRDAIDQGYLADYRLFAPPSNLDMGGVKIGSTGDYVRGQLSTAVKKSCIVGDIVAHYLRVAPGKRGVSFLPDVDTAKLVADQFKLAGVPAVAVSAKTPHNERAAALRAFKSREVLQLVNVDLFGEGFDLPAMEIVSFGRPTASYSLYVQQFGRVLRLLLPAELAKRWGTLTVEQRKAHIASSSKPVGIVMDHVGNYRHGTPDQPRQWTLERREKKSKSKPTVLLKTCLNAECLAVYERFRSTCPFCGTRPTPAKRSSPEFVDGDLTELSPAALRKIRGEIERVDMDSEKKREELVTKNAPLIGQLAGVKRHVEKQAAQGVLRDAIAHWGGYQRALGAPDPDSYRLFYLKFGTDVLTAQTLGPKEALPLASRINEDINRCPI